MKRQLIACSLIITFTLSISACGTVMFPERKGQINGQIDTQVAILNSIGLLFYLVPGVVAFAVDFNNGTIYLPGTQGRVDSDTDELQIVRSQQKIDNFFLETMLQDKMNIAVDLEQDNIVVQQLARLDDAKSVIGTY